MISDIKKNARNTKKGNFTKECNSRRRTSISNNMVLKSSSLLLLAIGVTARAQHEEEANVSSRIRTKNMLNGKVKLDGKVKRELSDLLHQPENDVPIELNITRLLNQKGFPSREQVFKMPYHPREQA